MAEKSAKYRLEIQQVSITAADMLCDTRGAIFQAFHTVGGLNLGLDASALRRFRNYSER